MGAGRSLRFRPGVRTPRPPRPFVTPPAPHNISRLDCHGICGTGTSHKRCYMTKPPHLRLPQAGPPADGSPPSPPFAVSVWGIRFSAKFLRRPGSLHITSSCAPQGRRGSISRGQSRRSILRQESPGVVEGCRSVGARLLACQFVRSVLPLPFSVGVLFSPKFRRPGRRDLLLWVCLCGAGQKPVRHRPSPDPLALMPGRQFFFLCAL
jgi:hypothetical protein